MLSDVDKYNPVSHVLKASWASPTIKTIDPNHPERTKNNFPRKLGLNGDTYSVGLIFADSMIV